MNKSVRIVPARIKEARESRGLSMAELSEIIGVTSQVISQYEKGITTPSIFVLKKIAEMLDFNIEFFYKPKDNLTCSNSAVYFRSMSNTSKKLKTAYSYRIEWANCIFNLLKKYIDFRELNIPDLDQYMNDDQISYDDIEEIARTVRAYWNLGNGPIENLIDVIEDNGIVVCGMNFSNKKIDAFSQWYDGTPYIFWGSDKISSVRMRFNVAHELGHLLLHPFLTQEQVYESKVLDRIEAEANYFAGALLMPSESIAKEMIHNSLDYLIILKEKWKVSIAALIMRAKQLDIFSENQASYLFRQMSARNMRSMEPLDDIIKIEEPKLLMQGLNLLVDNDIITANMLLDEMGLSRVDVQSICSLPDSFFKSEEQIKEDRMTLKIIK